MSANETGRVLPKQLPEQLQESRLQALLNEQL